MLTVLRYFFLMSLMRITPEVAPKSTPMLVILLVSNLVVQIAYFMFTPNVKMTLLLAISWAVLIITTTTLSLLVLMNFMQRLERFPRIFSSLQGCDIVLTLIRLMFLIALGMAAAGGALASALGILISLLQLYSFVIFGFVLTHAFEVRLFGGTCIAILLSVVSVIVVGVLLPFPELDPELIKRLTEDGLLKP